MYTHTQTHCVCKYTNIFIYHQVVRDLVHRFGENVDGRKEERMNVRQQDYVYIYIYIVMMDGFVYALFLHIYVHTWTHACVHVCVS